MADIMVCEVISPGYSRQDDQFCLVPEYYLEVLKVLPIQEENNQANDLMILLSSNIKIFLYQMRKFIDEVFPRIVYE